MSAPGHEVAVNPPELTAHATRLETLAAEVAATKQAGDSVRVGADAYGRLCAVVPVLLDSLQILLVEGIAAAVHSLDDSAERLREAAGGYQRTDLEREQENVRLKDAL